MSSRQHILDTPIEYLKGVGPKRADKLKKELRIFTFGDLLRHYPFRYVDKSNLQKIGYIPANSGAVQLRGRLSNIHLIGEGRGRRLTATLRDETGSIELVWFKGIAYFQRSLQGGQEYLVYGKPNQFRSRLSITHPEMELMKAQETEGPKSYEDRLEPIYSTTEKLKTSGLDSRGIHRLLLALLEKINPKSDITENLPPKIRERYQLAERWQAMKNIHRPENENWIKAARYRLKFEEFFFIQVGLLQTKIRRHRTEGFVFEKITDVFTPFYNEKLPFELTGAQKRVLKEIRRDVLGGFQMNRLVQGDVGSGKTVVALMSMLMAIDNGFQACLMAPTEILAQQHFEGISKMLEGMGLRVSLLTGSIKGKKRRLLLELLAFGEIDILIGTHALIEDPVGFNNLGLAVIDEQHRFGVAQRAKLWKKNTLPPHVLVMTATPIPRTLAMTVYGDLDVSIIDELPPGRKPIKTMHYFESGRLKVFDMMRAEIEKGRQIYIVYPLINESEALSQYKDLMEGYESITRAFPQPQYQVSVVHGQMHTTDKDFEMQRFKEGDTHIMVATTVIEVGVDVPNATFMLIESAERFGLAQLHQLRGRVGRSKHQSYCVLMTGHKLSNEGKVRMETMVDSNDGFKIAEVDMKLRGPGDIEGTQQSGVLNLKIADIIKDQAILARARQAAGEVVEEDPDLKAEQHQTLKRYLEVARQQRSEWSKIS